MLLSRPPRNTIWTSPCDVEIVPASASGVGSGALSAAVRPAAPPPAMTPAARVAVTMVLFTLFFVPCLAIGVNPFVAG
jgi:hypothetical protein